MTKNNADNAGVPAQKNRSKKFWGLRAAAVLVIAILTAGTIYIRGVKGVHKEELSKIKAEYRSLNQRVSRIDEAKKQRIEFYKNRLMADSPVTYSFTCADFIRRTSLIRTSGIVLSKIEITPSAQNLRFSIAGRATPGENTTDPKTELNRFYRQLGGVYEANVTSSKLGEGISFTLVGEIEVQ
ncbi:MAG: hypothetical protein KAT34_22905 [Candidatus Aminicenantes bacterium]|nr:hypothetical protein [Candidatus Aminicenantes bacterium]